MYNLKGTPGAGRDIERLKRRAPRQDFEGLSAAIRSLSEEPRPRGVRKLKGAEAVYRIRVGNYRIVYRVLDNERIVELVEVARRNEGTYRI